MLFTPEEESLHQPTIHLLDLRHADEDHVIRVNQADEDRFIQINRHRTVHHNDYDDSRRIRESTGSRLIGCSQGFLITYHEPTRTLRATHPFTGARLPLPPEPTFASNPTAVLSPSLSTILLNPAPDLYDLRQAGPFLSSTTHHPPKPSWISYHPILPFSVDIAFHRGLLHVLLEDGSLAVFDLDRPFASPLRVLPVLPVALSIPKPWYLVSSPSEDDLFLVSRVVVSEESPTSSTATVLTHEDAEFHDSGYHDWLIEGIYCCTESLTTSFAVYKLAPAENGLHYRWERVVDIGDTAMC